MSPEEAREIAAQAIADGRLQPAPVQPPQPAGRRPRTQAQRDAISQRVRSYWTPQARRAHGAALRAAHARKKAQQEAARHD